MAENRTDLTIRAKAEGFQQVQQAAAKISNEAAKAVNEQIAGFKKIEKSTSAYKKEVKELEGVLDGLAKQQLVVIRAMEQVGKGTEEHKKLKDVLKDINDQYQVQERRLQSTNRALKEQAVTSRDLARGSFTQGLLMGAAPEMGFIQRGPGMRRQVAGQMLGRMGRGFAMAPFGGVGGLQQGLQGIPIVGGMLAGQLGTAMGFAQGALGLQQQQLQAASMIAGGGASARIRAARARGMAGVSAAGFAPQGGFLSQAEIQARAEAMRRTTEAQMPGLTGAQRKEIAENVTEAQRAFARTRISERLAQFEGGATATQRKIVENIEYGRAEKDTRERERLTKIWEDTLVGQAKRKAGAEAAAETQRVLSAPEERYREARRGAGARAAAEERRRPFAGIYREGLKYGGLAQQEALQAVTGLLQRGGGTMADVRQQGMLRAGFAAQTAYGIGGDISGAFLQAGRRGGMVGAGGRGGEAMVEAIGDAMKLGLEGSEINEYMAQMAQGIQQFQQTGIPINSRSIATMGGVFSSAGLGGVRGRILGGGMQQAAQGLTQRGIQTATDLLMAQTLGGFKGGGMEDYEQAMMQLESGKFGEGPEGEERLRGFVGKLMKAGGGGAAGRQVVRQAFGGLGVRMGVAETQAFTQSIMGGELTPEQAAAAEGVRAQMARGAKEAPQGVAGLATQAQDILDAYGGAVRRAASLQNRQNEIGAKMLKPMQDLQASTLNINTAFTNLASGGLKDITGKIEELTKKIEKVTAQMDQLGGWKGWSALATGELF